MSSFPRYPNDQKKTDISILSHKNCSTILLQIQRLQTMKSSKK